MTELSFPGRGAPVFYADCVSSTSTVLKELARNGAADGTVFTARTQSGGRGRMGRSFASPEGGVYLSMLLRPRCTVEEALTLTPAAAVAVCRAIEHCCGVTPGIKWPNDLILSGKKVGGILCEASVGASLSVILGIGINVNTLPEDFPEDIRDSASSLLCITGREIDVSRLRKALIEDLDRMAALWQEEHRFCLAEYRAKCINPGRDISILRGDASVFARAVAVTDDYALKVRYPDGTEEDIRFGEVSIRNI